MFLFCRAFATDLHQQKNAASGCFQKQRHLRGTGGGTRTHTTLRSPDFESGASANSATPAKISRSISRAFLISNR